MPGKMLRGRLVLFEPFALSTLCPVSFALVSLAEAGVLAARGRIPSNHARIESSSRVVRAAIAGWLALVILPLIILPLFAPGK